MPRWLDVQLLTHQEDNIRTTIRPDDRIERNLRELSIEQKKEFGQVVNETLQLGVSALTRPTGRARVFRGTPERWGCRPRIDVEKLNPLVDDLEADDFAAKATIRRA